MTSIDETDPTVWLPTIISEAEKLASTLKSLAAQLGSSWIKASSSSRIGDREQEELERKKVTDCCRKLRTAVTVTQMKIKKLDKKMVSRYSQSYGSAAELDAHSETSISPRRDERLLLKIKNFREAGREEGYYAEIRASPLNTTESRSDKKATNDSRISRSKTDDLKKATSPVPTASEESSSSDIQQLQCTSPHVVESIEEVNPLELSPMDLQNEDEEEIEQMVVDSNEMPLKDTQISVKKAPDLKSTNQPQRNSTKAKMSAVNVSEENGSKEDASITSPPVTPKRPASGLQEAEELSTNSGEKQLTSVSNSERKPFRLKLKVKRSVDLNAKARHELLNDSEDSDDSLGDLSLSPRVKKTPKRNRSISLGLDDPKLKAECAVVIERINNPVIIFYSVNRSIHFFIHLFFFLFF